MAIQTKEKMNEEESKVQNQLQFKILCNMSVVAYENKNFVQQMRFLEQARKLQENSRLFYLLSLSEEKQEHFEESFDFMKRSHQLALQEQEKPETIQLYEKRVEKLEQVLKKVHRREKDVYSKMLLKKEIYGDKPVQAKRRTEIQPMGCLQKVKAFISSLFSKKQKVN